TKPPTGQGNLGEADEIINTLGAKLPKDVDPNPGELSVSYTDACSPATPTIHNPRDGISTIIASTSGEEAFVDQNANGTYDGDELVDCNGNCVLDVGPVDEAFVDWNNNGVYDLGEPFRDCNGNGVRDTAVTESFIDKNGNSAYDVG